MHHHFTEKAALSNRADFSPQGLLLDWKTRWGVFLHEGFSFIEDGGKAYLPLTNGTYDFDDSVYGTEYGRLMKIEMPAVNGIPIEIDLTYNEFGQVVTNST